jgi:hypothetical protein
MSESTAVEKRKVRTVADLPIGAKVTYQEHRMGGSYMRENYYLGRVIGHDGSAVLWKRHRIEGIARYDLNEEMGSIGGWHLNGVTNFHVKRS